MNLPPEKFVQKEKCPKCGHNVSSHRPTNTIDGTVIKCKALDAAGDECDCEGPEVLKRFIPVVWSR